MALASRKLHPPIADDCIEALREILNKSPASCGDGRLPNFLVRRLGAAVADILQKRPIKKSGILRHKSEGLSKACLGDPANILSVDSDAASLDIVESLQERLRG